MTEHQFIVGVEKCCRGGISQQLRFLFAMYEDDSNAVAPAAAGAVAEESERKEQLKALLCDCTFLAKQLYGRYDTNAQDVEQQQDDDKDKDGAEQEEEEAEEKPKTKKEGKATLEETGEDLHMWEKRAINPLLEGLLTYNEREGSGGRRTVAIDTFVTWASDTVTHLFKSTVEVLVRRRFLELQFSGQPATSSMLTASASAGGQAAAAGSAPVASGQVPFRLPEIDHVMNRKQLILDQARLWVLSSMVNAQDRAVPWRILYSSTCLASMRVCVCVCVCVC
jgi:hypothetical protein